MWAGGSFVRVAFAPTDELAGQLGLRMIGTVPSLPESVRRQPIPVHGQEMYWHSRLTEAVDSITTLLLHEASRVGGIWALC